MNFFSSRQQKSNGFARSIQNEPSSGWPHCTAAHDLEITRAVTGPATINRSSAADRAVERAIFPADIEVERMQSMGETKKMKKYNNQLPVRSRFSLRVVHLYICIRSFFF